jgi:hypothetical protein
MVTSRGERITSSFAIRRVGQVRKVKTRSPRGREDVAADRGLSVRENTGTHRLYESELVYCVAGSARVKRERPVRPAGPNFDGVMMSSARLLYGIDWRTSFAHGNGQPTKGTELVMTIRLRGGGRFHVR